MIDAPEIDEIEEGKAKPQVVLVPPDAHCVIITKEIMWIVGGASSIVVFLCYFILHVVLIIETRQETAQDNAGKDIKANHDLIQSVHEDLSLLKQRVDALEGKKKQETSMEIPMQPADRPRRYEDSLYCYIAKISTR